MKKKRKKIKRYKSKKRYKKVLKKYFKKSRAKSKRKIAKKSKKRTKKTRREKVRKSSKNTILKIIRFQELLTPKFNFNFNLDKTIQNFFQKFADKIEEYKAIKEKENERKRLEKVK